MPIMVVDTVLIIIVIMIIRIINIIIIIIATVVVEATKEDGNIEFHLLIKFPF